MSFLYFAYGSNMLTKRIHINNPTAVQRYIGKLKDYRLDFNMFAKRWHGAAATIVPQQGSEVWGVVWEINMSNLPDLDNQEGVSSNVYCPKIVKIDTTGGKSLECRVYQQCQLPDKYVEPSLLPPNRQPSLIYLNTMIKGAKEFNIPNDYIKFLETFLHNGYNGEVEVVGIR
ncbi:gamma-glutamylcyclotransferase [Copidosoma floridanum]|uniref:gamma-glutamylcyclotransferase n=1 Tax=Copidosoma floridanum TaxID=29053 RepID=UPI0006C968F4|nr:gamma-glutamylcyclotransferase [Copidosoma floridanum]